MLNLGSIPAPYSKKTGDKMVLPTFKNNLFDKSFTIGAGDATYGTQQTAVAVGVLSNFISVKPNTVYKVYMFNNTGTPLYYGVNPYAYDTNKNFFGNNTTGRPTFSNLSGDGSVGTTSGYQFTTSANTYFVRLQVNRGTGSFSFAECQSLNSTLQLEEGVNNTPYAVQLNKKPQRKTTAKTGLAFNGGTDFVDFPYQNNFSSDKITCNVNFIPDNANPSYQGIIAQRESVSGTRTAGFVLYLVSGGSYQLWIGTGSGAWIQLNLGSANLGKLTNIYFELDYIAKSVVVFIDGVKVHSSIQSQMTKSLQNPLRIGGSANESPYVSFPYKGTVLNAKLTNGINEIINIDFTNPRNIAGNQIIPNAQNLIPSFEDARWSIHANAKVMGKDVLHLDATFQYQNSELYLPCLPSSKFLSLGTISQNADLNVVYYGSDKNTYLGETSSLNTPFTVPNNCYWLRIRLRNMIATGSFDFIRPQLYQLTGQEGTVNGSPIMQLKSSKRTRYNTR
jgi:hypothetical protein